jgi:hypothetical protein
MEYVALHDAGNRMKDMEIMFDFDDSNDPANDYFLRLVTTPVPFFNCPTKRLADLYPMHEDHGQLAHNVPVCTHGSGCRVARGDYLVNSGNINAGDLHGPLLTFTKPWYPVQKPSKLQNGISYMRSEVRVGEITDGASKTALVGEKYQDPDNYFTGWDHYDNQCIYSGHNSDANGYTGTTEGFPEITVVKRPRQDTPGARLAHIFGSAHFEGLHMAYCDGSVHFIGYDVSGPVWYALGGRDDEEKAPRRED